MKHLIIGYGQIGQAIHKVLGEADHIDKGQAYIGKVDVIHICFPYSTKFVKLVKGHIKKYQPKLVIIHSTVALGTTDLIGDIAVHSPVRGVHPNLYDGIMTFVKYFGGLQARKAAKIFIDLGVKTKTSVNSRDTEAGKMLDTTYYGWNLMFEKSVKEYCDHNNLDFDLVYRQMNETYNEGYKELGMSNVVRPVYKHMEGKIGGHCVISNCKFLKFKPAKIILNKNNQL